MKQGVFQSCPFVVFYLSRQALLNLFGQLLCLNLSGVATQYYPVAGDWLMYESASMCIHVCGGVHVRVYACVCVCVCYVKQSINKKNYFSSLKPS